MWFAQRAGSFTLLPERVLLVEFIHLSLHHKWQNTPVQICLKSTMVKLSFGKYA